MKIPVCEPSIGEKELANVVEAVKSGWISGYQGKFIDEFEERFAQFCGCRYGVATTNCASAMLLALESLGIGKGDEVITTDFTMIATVSAIIHAGATPVLVDAEPDTWCLDPALVEEKVTPRTRAIMPVTIYGHPVDINALIKIAERHKLVIIEDAAEAIGARQYGFAVGALSDVACFSYYINKTIVTGEGGMLVTDDEELASVARRLRGYDTDPNNRFTHQKLGFNYRLSNIACAIGCAQMDRIDQFVTKKREIAQWYRAGLAGMDGVTLPVERPWAVNGYWVFGILLESEEKRDGVVKRLAAAGVETRNFFHPMHDQLALPMLWPKDGETFPAATDIGRRGLYLPNGVTLTEEQAEYVCQELKVALRA